MGGASNDGAVGKKKTKQHLPLPSVEAVVDKLPFSVDYKAKSGRHAVAKVDMPAGTPVMLEEPIATTARTRAALQFCHRCFVPIPPPKPPKSVKALEEGNKEEAPATDDAKAADADADGKAASESAEVSKEGEAKQAEQEDTPPSLDPCLPRYCTSCTGRNAELDARLAACRSRLLPLCKKLQLEPELLQLLLLLDVQRAQHSKRMAQDMPPAAAVAGAAVPPALRCTTDDMAALPSMWDRKGKAWRTMVVTATKALHKELTLLAESGAVPGYTPSTLAQLQALVGAFGYCLQGVGREGSSAEPGLGLFPALTLFPHSCVPNCAYAVVGRTLVVRTLVDIPAGTPLSVSYISLYEPRGVRHHQLLQQRAQVGCGCARCAEPLETSTDRMLEGVWCFGCRTDVLVQLPANEKWEAEYKAQVEKEAEAAGGAAVASAGAAGAGSKKGGGKSGKKGGKPAVKEAEAGAEAAEKPEPAANGSGSEEWKGEAEKQEGEGGEGAQKEESMFWRCCGCRRLEPAKGSNGLEGPLDVDEQATQIFSNAMLMLQMKASGQALARAEEMLNYVRLGCGGRLHPYNIHCLDAMDPLLQIQLRKSDALAVFNTALLLWESQRLILDLPTHSQLQYLAAIEDALKHKATNASSTVMKRQFERKAKAALSEMADLKKVLFGQ